MEKIDLYKKSLKNLRLSTAEVSKEINDTCIKDLKECIDLVEQQHRDIEQLKNVNTQLTSEYTELKEKYLDNLERVDESEQYRKMVNEVIPELFKYMTPLPNGTSVTILNELLNKIGMRIR